MAQKKSTPNIAVIKADKFEKFVKEKINTATYKPFTRNNPKSKDGAIEFTSYVQEGGQNLPVQIFIDKTIYTMIQIIVANGVVRIDNKERILECLNRINISQKIYKYGITPQNQIIMMATIPSTENDFNPEMVWFILRNIMVTELSNGGYESIMKSIWAVPTKKA